MGKNYPDIKPGEIVSGGFTYPNNAQIVGDSLYIRDENGNTIAGRQTDNGDKITVLDVGYTKQLTLIQYPAGTSVRQGYVTNNTNIIKYINQGAWKNGSSAESVYDENNTVIGSLDPYEVATPLYKISDGKTHVVYNTSKGANTKSGYVVYAGANGSSNPTGGINPGEVVPGGFTYPNNAQVIGDDLYIRDANGNTIAGRQVSNGDRITVLDVGYTKQLTLVQYPAGSVVRQGYVTNVPSLIKYDRQGEWHNGSSAEEVLDENGAHLGSLDPYEAATPLYKKNGMTHVVYNTDKGPNTKSGYVRYEGSSISPITIPQVSVAGAQRIVYGTSGKGRDLAAYKIGSGSNSLVFVCEQHGFEDNWSRDGIELVYIGNDLINSLAGSSTNGWTVYVIPAANPDGLIDGYTNNGPGRCTIVGAVDTNRDYPIGFTPHGTTRNWTGDAPLSVSESRSLSTFIQGVKNSTSGEMVVIDLHGWENAAIGDPQIGQFFRNQFGFEQRNGYGEDSGFMIAWAKSIGAKAALIELPTNTHSHDDVVNGGYSQKVINAVKNLMGTISMEQLNKDAKSIMNILKIELNDFKLNHEFVVYNGPIYIKYEFGLTPFIGSSNNTVSVKDGKIENIEWVFDKLSVVTPIVSPSIGNLTSILEDLVNRLGISITNGTIKFGFNTEEKTIEIEIAKERQDQKLFTKISVGFNELPDKVVNVLATGGKILLFAGLVALSFYLLVEGAGVAIVAIFVKVISALAEALG
ncbi:M14 family zinc carboxypeptidase [Clostridium sp. C8-1-8]|uniref:M14 family zinc carboxypeptidase n=1 Tax=Clostridium sp. C8-1-8 TaxID=2698831 RepID=UPI00136F9B7F|nr:M14 family zinc carboxypeptidase [Clostridium sp. C8-1-8]